MQLKVADEEIVTLTDVANMAGEVVIQKYTLSFMLWADFIVD